LQKFTAAERVAILRRWNRAFGRALEYVRDKLRGLSQQDLADRMGWESRTTVAKLEAGTRPASSCESRLLAQVLDIKHDDLMKLTDTFLDLPESASNSVSATQSPNADGS
jgi:ribosome-binding protein aMBF1 (putative translation factor)